RWRQQPQLGVTRRGLKMKFRGLQRQPGLLNSTGRSRRPRWSGCSVKNIMDAQVCSSIDVPIDDKIGSQKKSSRPDDGNSSSPPPERISAKLICATKLNGHGRAAWPLKTVLSGRAMLKTLPAKRNTERHAVQSPES